MPIPAPLAYVLCVCVFNVTWRRCDESTRVHQREAFDGVLPGNKHQLLPKLL